MPVIWQISFWCFETLIQVYLILIFDKHVTEFFNDVIPQIFWALRSLQLICTIVLYFRFILFFISHFVLSLRIWDCSLMFCSCALSFARCFTLPVYRRSSRAINRSLPILNSPYRRDAFAAALFLLEAIGTYIYPGRRPATNREAIRGCILVGGSQRCRSFRLCERRHTLSSWRPHDADVVTHERGRPRVARCIVIAHA